MYTEGIVELLTAAVLGIIYWTALSRMPKHSLWRPAVLLCFFLAWVVFSIVAECSLTHKEHLGVLSVDITKTLDSRDKPAVLYQPPH